MRVREVINRPVIDTSTATIVGRLDELVIDPARKRIVALRVAGVKGAANLLAWKDLSAFGADALTVESVERVRGVDAFEPSWVVDPVWLGKRILSDKGNGLGQVMDLEFDARTGRLETILTTEGPRPAAAVLGLGSYALVMAEDAAPLKAMTRDELYQRAKELGLPGRSSMTKKELLRALS